MSAESSSACASSTRMRSLVQQMSPTVRPIAPAGTEALIARLRLVSTEPTGQSVTELVVDYPLKETATPSKG